MRSRTPTERLRRSNVGEAMPHPSAAISSTSGTGGRCCTVRAPAVPAAAAGRAERAAEAGPGQLPELTAAQIRSARGRYAQLCAGWPAEVREPLLDHLLGNWRTGLRETANFEGELYDELRAGGPLPDVPLTVLTAGGRNPYRADRPARRADGRGQDGMRATHAAVAASVPRGRQVVVEGASHQHMHVESPDAVIRAVHDLLATARPRRAAAPPGPGTATVPPGRSG